MQNPRIGAALHEQALREKGAEHDRGQQALRAAHAQELQELADKPAAGCGCAVM